MKKLYRDMPYTSEVYKHLFKGILDAFKRILSAVAAALGICIHVLMLLLPFGLSLPLNETTCALVNKKRKG